MSFSIFKKRSTRQIGELGEEAVCRYLTERGFEILEKNYTFRHLEIDIIAKNETYLVFCEVKTRKEGSFPRFEARPSTAVNEEKRSNLLRCAKQYLLAHFGTDHPPELQPRMDVAEVWYTDQTASPSFRIRYIERAFGKGHTRHNHRFGGQK